ncbi:hypothetical protein AXF42_Ash021394 [Apostasia shenzhenica]|uniref:Uncharacterized protein n=1 Tax=Apostasia shenzhenica TaxID=1088818 RepID=A0A2H9ZYM2_9ASPA|nr:hypothetical protein AXF42_Ash021394 [Apostasia shenzhenica]
MATAMAELSSMSRLSHSGNSTYVIGEKVRCRKLYHVTVAMRNLRRTTSHFSSSSANGQNLVETLVKFPRDYSELLEQEIEFPTASLRAVPGDGEGGIEMNESMQLIREFADLLVAPEKASRTRIVKFLLCRSIQ